MDVTVFEKDEALFTCELSQIDVKVDWLKNGDVLKTGKDCAAKKDGSKHTLQFPWTSVDDMGTYSIRARFAKSTAYLTVNGKQYFYFMAYINYILLEPPKDILEHLTNASVDHMGTVSFSCVVSPRDQKVNWYIGEESMIEIQASDKYQMKENYKTRSLTIKNCTESDRFGNMPNHFVVYYITNKIFQEMLFFVDLMEF